MRLALRACAVLCMLAATTARAELVAYYNFDGEVEDASGKGNHPSTIRGGNFLSDVPAQIGSGSSFAMDGIVSGFDVPDSATLDVDTALTISAWVNMDNANTFYFIAAKQPSGTAPANYPGNFELRLAAGSAQPQFLHQTSDGTTFTQYNASVGVPIIEWHHVAFTIQDGGSAKFYIDGTNTDTFAVLGEFGILNDNPMIVGARADGFSNFFGYLDELTIWNEALSPGKIAALAGGSDPLNLPDFNPADINIDGVVNIDDYTILRDHFGTGTKFEEGDIDGNGRVDGRDFRILKNNFGVGGSGLTVPEPSSALLVSIGLAMGFCVWRRR